MWLLVIIITIMCVCVWLADGRSLWRSLTRPGQWPRNGFIRLSCSKRIPTIGAAKPYSSAGRRPYNHSSIQCTTYLLLLLFFDIFFFLWLWNIKTYNTMCMSMCIPIIYVIINRTVAFSRYLSRLPLRNVLYILLFFFIPSTT